MCSPKTILRSSFTTVEWLQWWISGGWWWVTGRTTTPSPAQHGNTQGWWFGEVDRVVILVIVSLCFYWIFAGSLNSWTTCLGRTCGTTTSTGPPTSRSALPATSTSHLLVRHFWFLLRLSLFLVSGHFETLSWDLHLLANKTGLPQWDDKRVSDIIFKITIEQNQHFHPFQEIVQYATHQKVSEEYYATVEKEAIRKLYKRWFFYQKTNQKVSRKF